MSKRLRKRIRELCGLEGLDKLERHRLAESILDDVQFKQSLCNQVPGLSFRDIDRTMKNVLAESPNIKRDQEEEELRKIAPQKFNPGVENILPRRKNKRTEYRTLTPEETRKLLEASEKPIKQEKKAKKEYDTWTLEEVAALIAGTYDPKNFKRKKKVKKG